MELETVRGMDLGTESEFLGTDVAEVSQCKLILSAYLSREDVNGRTTQRTLGRRRRVEVWRRMHFNHFDLYYRVLVTRLRKLLNTKGTRLVPFVITS